MRTNTATNVLAFNANGGGGQFVYNFNNWISGVADLGAVHSGNIGAAQLDIRLHLRGALPPRTSAGGSRDTGGESIRRPACSIHPHAWTPRERGEISRFKTILFPVSLLSLMLVVPVCGEDFSRLNFNIGGGTTTPLNPTANFVGLGGNFAVGAGYNINKHNSISGEIMWNGLPPNTVIHIPNAPFGSINLYNRNHRLQREQRQRRQRRRRVHDPVER